MRQKKGVALIITLLVALILFIAIITISSSMSVSSRRVTTDQKVALEAQYAAESGLSLAAATLPKNGKEMADMLNDRDALEMPRDTTWSGTVARYVEMFCGKGVPLSPPNTSRHLICKADLSKVSWSGGKQPYKLLEDYVDPKKYPKDPSTGHPYNPHKFWRERIGLRTYTKTIKSGPEKSSYLVRFGFLPSEAWAYEDNSVHLFFKGVATSTGKIENKDRNLATRKVKQEFYGRLEIILRPPSFSRYMSFTNYQRAGTNKDDRRVFFYNGTLFDGPVHTNEHFNFIDKPWFGDEVTSAGCVTEDGDKKDCLVSKPAFYYWDKKQGKPVQVSAPPDSVPPYAEPIYSKKPDWKDEYIPLPEGGSAQIQAAKSGGIYFPDRYHEKGDVDITHVILSIGEEGGKKYQYIQVRGRKVVNVEKIYGRCVKNGGGKKAPAPAAPRRPSPVKDSPDVRINPDLPIQALRASSAKTSLVHWLAAAAQIASSNNRYYAQADRCPKGQHWEPYGTPLKRQIFSKDPIIYNFRVDENGLAERLEHGTWVLHRRHFNGVIYAGKYSLVAAGKAGLPKAKNIEEINNPRKEVFSKTKCKYTHTEWKGKHYCIEPSIASFTKLTAAGHEIKIPNDITYEERPCSSAPERLPDGTVKRAVCKNLKSTNILGIYADNQNIEIDYNAPPNMFIDAVLMAGKKRVYFGGWKGSKPRGNLHLTGGIIQNWYGRFGRLNDDLTVKSGYGRKFTYDPRMRDGKLTPPFFPTFDKGKWKGKVTFKRTGGGNGFWTPLGGE